MTLRYGITVLTSRGKVLTVKRVTTRREADKLTRIAREMAEPGSCFGFAAVQLVKLLPTLAPVITWRRTGIGQWQTINHTARAAEGK